MDTERAELPQVIDPDARKALQVRIADLQMRSNLAREARREILS